MPDAKHAYKVLSGVRLTAPSETPIPTKSIAESSEMETGAI